jgi:hypothetical protein
MRLHMSAGDALIDLSLPAEQVSQLVAVEFSDRRDPVNVTDQILGGAKERREADLALATANPADASWC